MRTFTVRERIGAAFNVLPTAIDDTFPAVLLGRVLTIVSRLGLFDTLNDHPQTPHEVASGLGLHPGSMELILPALATANYLKERRGKYDLRPQARKWLVRSSPHYLGNFLAYTEILHAHWSALESTFKNGKPPSSYPETFTEKEWRIYTLGMMDLAKLIIPRLMPELTIPAGATSLLDLCGSHGLYAIELCKRHPELKATIADFPQVLTTTREIVADHGMAKRVTLMPCDVTKSTFTPTGHDVVLAFNIVHGFDEATNQRFFKTIGGALKPHGIVYIMDQLMPATRTGARAILPLMVGINLQNETGGTIYSFAQIRGWCELAGLGTTQHRRLSLPGVSLVLARKES